MSHQNLQIPFRKGYKHQAPYRTTKSYIKTNQNHTKAAKIILNWQ